MELHSNASFLALPTNIRLGCKLMVLANTLAYYNTGSITSVNVYITGPGEKPGLIFTYKPRT
jgi:hypothetical protein